MQVANRVVETPKNSNWQGGVMPISYVETQKKPVDMISSAVVIDWGPQECLPNFTISGDSIEDSCRSDVDDAFSCRTDQTTVRASNVRRVTLTPTMDQESAEQLIRRLFAGLRDDIQSTLPMILYGHLRVYPNVEPADAVHQLHNYWSLGGVELSEEIYEALAEFRGDRRVGFMNELYLVAMPRNNSESDQGVFGSQVSFVAESGGGTSTTDSLTTSLSGEASTGASVHTESNAAVGTMLFNAEDSPSSTLPDTGSQEIAEQLIRRLFASLRDNFQSTLPMILYSYLQVNPNLEPADAVHHMWSLQKNVELLEEIYEALVEFGGERRVEFMNALSLVAMPQNRSERDQDSFHSSQVSFGIYLHADNASTTARLTNLQSLGALTVDGNTDTTVCTLLFDIDTENHLNSSLPDTGSQNQDDANQSDTTVCTVHSALVDTRTKNQDANQSAFPDIPHPVETIGDLSHCPDEVQVPHDDKVGAWNQTNCCIII